MYGLHVCMMRCRLLLARTPSVTHLPLLLACTTMIPSSDEINGYFQEPEKGLKERKGGSGMNKMRTDGTQPAAD